MTAGPTSATKDCAPAHQGLRFRTMTPMISRTKDPGEAAVLTMLPFESDPKIIVLTYPVWCSEVGEPFFSAFRQIAKRWDSGEIPPPSQLDGAVFDAKASGLEFRTDAHLSVMILMLKLFLGRQTPFAISGASESVINLFSLMGCSFFLLADSLAEAAGICSVIGPSIRSRDEEAFQRIWVEHMAAFYGRNGRTAPRREMPPAKVAGLYLRSQAK